MNSDPIIDQSSGKLDIVILGSAQGMLNALRGIIIQEFPECRLKVSHSLAHLKLPPPSNLPLLFLTDYHALQTDGTEFLKRLRILVPNVWICIVTNDSELVIAFDNFGAMVDDILPFDDQFAISLRNSINRILSASELESSPKIIFNVKTIPPNLLLESMHDSFIVVDGDGLLLYANDVWINKFQNPKAERTYFSDVIHPNDLHRIEADLQLAIIEKGNSNAVFRVQSKDERWETLQATISGFESEGVHVAFICARVVTELHRLQTRLQELEMQNSLNQNYIESVVYRYNLQSRNLQYIAEIPLLKFGYSSDDLVNLKSTLYEKLIDPDDFALFQTFIENLTRRGSGSTQESSIMHHLVCKDGSLRFVEHIITLDWSRDGSHYWINGAIKDVVPEITEITSDNLADNDRAMLIEAMLEGMAEFEIVKNHGNHSIGMKCVSCNKTFENLIGISRERIIGSLLCDLFPGLDETPLNIDSEESLPQVLQNIASGSEPRTIEDYFWPHLRAYFNISATSIRTGNISVMLTDVTRRKHAEIRLATLLRGLPDTALYQTGGGVEYISDGVSQMLGYSPEVFQNDRNFFVSLIHPDDRDELKKLQNKWISKGSRRVLELEFRARHKDGHYIWILDRMSKAFTTPDGRQSSQGVMIDITARKQAEADRQIEVAEMEAIFQALPDLLFRLDKDGIILNYRAGREDLLLLKPEEFLNKSMLSVLPPAVGIKFKSAMKTTIKTRNQTSVEYFLDVPAGKMKFEAKFFFITDNLITVVVRKL